MDVEFASPFRGDLVASTGGRRIVVSTHDFNGVPRDVTERLRAMRSTGAEIVKLAVMTRSLSDNLQLLQLERAGKTWTMRRRHGVLPYASADADTQRIWWSDAGVHQNLTFPVHPDPISGMHCWHQAVRVRRAEPGDRYADIVVDTAKSRAVYAQWLARTRPAASVSPDGTRRPYWLLRPLKPAREVYALPKKPT